MDLGAGWRPFGIFSGEGRGKEGSWTPGRALSSLSRWPSLCLLPTHPHCPPPVSLLLQGRGGQHAAWGKGQGWGWQRREGCFHQQSIAPLVLDQFPEAK